MVSSNFPNRPFGLREACWSLGQEITNNRTLMHGELWVDRYNSNYGTFSLGNNSSFTFHMNGSQVAGWSFGYDFRAYNNLLVAAVDVWVGHNADGSKTFTADGYANMDIMGYTEVHTSFGLPTIPRASTVVWAVQGDAVAGVAKQLNTNRASSSFTHDVDYVLGATTARALTGIGDSGMWTPPMSLLNEMPNTDRGLGKLRTWTYNGGSFIGSTESSFALVPDAGVIPTWTSATIVDATSGITAILGAGKYLQNISKLTGTIAGASGVYGSTITAYRQAVGTETISAASAPFTKVLSTSGTAVPVTQEITDSRGRKKTLVTNIDVLPYSKPVVVDVSMARTTGTTPDVQGTDMAVAITAAVQSVINTTERNRLTVKIYTKLRSASTWTLQATPVSDSSTLGYTNLVFITGPFTVDNAYDVRVDVIDKFSTSSGQKVLPTAEIFQHWSTGMGLGKYWERGMLDISGDAYASAGMLSMGKRTTNWNTAVQEGRWHANTASNGPSAPPSGQTSNQLVGDVEVWYEVQGASVFHYISQRVRWISSGANLAAGSNRGLITSFGLGYAMMRYSSDGGTTWSAWRPEDPKATVASVGTNGLTYVPQFNRYDFSTAARLVLLDGVFKSDFCVFRVDYSYRTSDNNLGVFQLRSGSTQPAGIQYNTYHQSGQVSGTPAGTLRAAAGSAYLCDIPSEAHSGHLTIYNPMSTTAGVVKAWTGEEVSPGNNAHSTFGGSLGGTGADTTAFDGIRMYLNNQAINTYTNGWIRVTAIG